MSILLAALLALQPAEAAPPPPIIQRPVVTGRLVIPDEIAPAVVPYLRCLLTQQGVEIRGPNDPRPPKAERGGDCAQVRKVAGENADILLRRLGGRSDTERHDFIDKTLVSMEDFAKAAAAPIAPGSQTNATN